MTGTDTSFKNHPLDDPRIDRVWVDAAARLGFEVDRTTAAYASYLATAGRGRIAIGTPETLDADDSVAQLVFHELCHALVQGQANLTVADWGLDNTSDRDLPAEHACLRLQAHLADRHALRPLMTPTTISRGYYQQLAAFPLEGNDQAARLAQTAVRQPLAGWLPALDQALEATAAIVRAEGRWSGDGHPLGLKLGGPERCGTCVWRHGGGVQGRCRQVTSADGNGHRVDDDFPACVAWEPALDCQACAACCREGFDSVAVGVRESVTWQHPELVVRNGPRFFLARSGGQCAALRERPDPPWSCAIYPDRPQACREVQPGDRRCLVARRRVGLSLHG
jgi:hypothetical protein